MHRLARLGLAFATCGLACTAPKPGPLLPPPRIVSFTASAIRVAPGAAVTLSWQVQDATEVELVDSFAGPLEGADSQEGSLEVKVARSSLFVLSAKNERGVRDSAVLEISTGSAAEVLFVATPSITDANQPVVLAWSAPGARAVNLAEQGGPAVELAGQLTSGKVTVHPAVDTTYVLSVDGQSFPAPVAVRPTITSFSANPTFARPGGQVTLQWNTAGATRLVLESPTRGTLATITDPAQIRSGTFEESIPLSVDPGSVFSYALVAEGSPAAGKATRPLTLAVSAAPRIVDLVTPEYARTGKSFRAAWTTTGAETVEISAGGTVVFRTPQSPAAASGYVELPTPSTPTEYTFTALQGRGASTSATRTVTPVGNVSLQAFSASSTTLAAGGDPLTLSWNVPGARRLRIVANGQQTVLTIRGSTAETGTVEVAPNGPTTYRLDATNGAGDFANASVSVALTQPAVFSYSPGGPIFEGSTVGLDFAVGSNSEIYGLQHSDVELNATSTGFIDISSTGTALSFTNTDNGVASFAPDFETFLYGQRLAGPVTVSTNGFLVLGSTAQARGATTLGIPSASLEDNFIAPFWKDLKLGTGAIYWQVLGEAPEQRLIVQWDEVQVSGEPNSLLSFQAQLHQSGVVTFEYKKIATSATPVIGLQGTGRRGLSYGFAVTNGQSLTFFGPKRAPVPVRFDNSLPLSGFVRLGAAYLPMVFRPNAFIAAADLSISEVLYRPAPAIETSGEWFEVRNGSSVPIDLAGWTLELGGAQHPIDAVHGSTVVPPRGTLVLGQSPNGAANDGVATEYVYGPGLAMPDTLGTITLRRTGFSFSATWDSSQPQGGPGICASFDPGPVLLAADSYSAVPHSLVCSATAAFGTQSPRQLGTPGTPSSCFGYRLERRAVSYFDISGSGTPLFNTGAGDDQVASVTLGSAPITLFGALKSTMTVSTNGWLALKAVTDSAYSNRSRPSTSSLSEPIGAIAPFWDDLDFRSGSGSNVYSKRVAAGEDPSNPIAHWIIQWHHLQHLASADDLNFQVKLFDDGVVEFHFAQMLNGPGSTTASGTSATTWLESPTGAAALIINSSEARIFSNTAYRLVP